MNSATNTAVHIRPCLGLLAAVAVGAMAPSYGFYTWQAAVDVLLGLLLALAACSIPDWQCRGRLALNRLPVLAVALFLLGQSLVALLSWVVYNRQPNEPAGTCGGLVRHLTIAVMVVPVAGISLRRRGPGSFAVSAVAGAALLAAAEGVLYCDVFSNATVPRAERSMLPASCAGLAVLVWLICSLGAPDGKRRRWFWVQVFLLFLTGAALRVAAVAATPNPRTDVFTVMNEAPGHLLAGRNPYSGAYTWPYESPPNLEYDALPAYPPLPLLAGVPFRLTGLDVRFANVACDLLAALVLVWLAQTRGNAPLGALAAAAYLHFPRVPFVMEQAWYEPMLAAALGGGLLLVDRGWRLGYVILGLGLTGKQYGVVMALPLLKALRRHRLALGLGIGVVAAGVLLPFLLWDHRAFLEVVLFKHLRRPPREDALTLHAAAEHMFQINLPGWLSWLAAGGVIAWISWRAPAQAAASALWVGTALLTFVLCHSQGFFNYFYLCEYLFLLGALALLTESELALAKIASAAPAAEVRISCAHSGTGEHPHSA